MKVSIIVPVYFNQDNLQPLYDDLCKKLFSHSEYEWELVMVNDGSKDNSFEVMKKLADSDSRIKIYSLSRNFGSHAAILCGLNKCTGDCAVVKAADMQEPTELILEMVESWKQGNNVVLACRQDREESFSQKLFANMYYGIVRKSALPSMPKGGFDIFLIDRKVINVLMQLDEKNSAITGQILWSGFKTSHIYYLRKAREIGKSRWTLKKKIRLVMDTLFSFSTLPISLVMGLGVFSIIVAIVWGLFVLISSLSGHITVTGWTTLFLLNLFSFGTTMLTLGVIGNYLWRTFDASRNRPPFIIEYDSDINREKENK